MLKQQIHSNNLTRCLNGMFSLSPGVILGSDLWRGLSPQEAADIHSWQGQGIMKVQNSIPFFNFLEKAKNFHKSIYTKNFWLSMIYVQVPLTYKPPTKSAILPDESLISS